VLRQPQRAEVRLKGAWDEARGAQDAVEGTDGERLRPLDGASRHGQASSDWWTGARRASVICEGMSAPNPL